MQYIVLSRGDTIAIINTVIIVLILSLIIIIMYAHIHQLEMRIDWVEDKCQFLTKKLLKLEKGEDKQEDEE